MIWPIVIVQQAETIVVERLGSFDRILSNGVNFLIPFLEKPRQIHWLFAETDVSGNLMVRTHQIERIDLREQVFNFPSQNVITRDNVTIEIDALLYFKIIDPVKAVYEIANLPNAIEKLTQTTLRSVIGEMDLDECLASRETINTKLRTHLDEITDKWGVDVTRVELQDINPPRDIQEAMEKQMRAERDRRAVILTAEGAKQAKILEAQGFREAAILKAQGDADARKTLAQGEKEAIALVSGSIAKLTKDPTTYMIATRYIEALKEMVSGQDNKVIYMPYEASGVLGSLGSLKELFIDQKN